MPEKARIGDKCSGLCYDPSHAPNIPYATDGTITGPGAPSVTTEGSIVATEGDTVTSSCGHTGTIDPTGSTVNAEGKPVARKGDSFSGTYIGTIQEGAATVTAG